MCSVDYPEKSGPLFLDRDVAFEFFNATSNAVSISKEIPFTSISPTACWNQITMTLKRNNGYNKRMDGQMF